MKPVRNHLAGYRPLNSQQWNMHRNRTQNQTDKKPMNFICASHVYCNIPMERPPLVIAHHPIWHKLQFSEKHWKISHLYICKTWNCVTTAKHEVGEHSSQTSWLQITRCEGICDRDKWGDTRKTPSFCSHIRAPYPPEGSPVSDKVKRRSQCQRRLTLLKYGDCVRKVGECGWVNYFDGRMVRTQCKRKICACSNLRMLFGCARLWNALLPSFC